jgi:hypothetical protein
MCVLGQALHPAKDAMGDKGETNKKACVDLGPGMVGASFCRATTFDHQPPKVDEIKAVRTSL